METQYSDEALAGVVRVVTLIKAALVMGLIGVGVVVLVTVELGPLAPLELLTIVGLASAAVMIPLAFVAPRLARQAQLAALARSQQAEQAGSPSLLSVYQGTEVIRGAVWEGPAMLNLVVCFIEHNPASLIAAGLLTVGLLAGLPTRNSVRDWLDEARQDLQSMDSE